MNSVAIIITAASYVGDLHKLPACLSDNRAIARIVEEKKDFNHILNIHDEKTAVLVQEKLFSFLKNLEGETLDEVFFYFSGHGEFFDNDFLYLMCDYRSSKKRQTSVSNLELDNAVRVLQPRLYTKIVDACHSGIPYIKDSTQMAEYVQKSSAALRDLYFLFSSQLDEVSWQGDRISYFTASVLRSILQHEGATIKYKDTIHFISDEFEQSGIQKPFFVNQGSYTDVFCSITSELKADLRKFLEAGWPSAEVLEARKNTSIVDLVREEAKMYCDKDTTLKLVSSLKDDFAKFKLDNDCGELYEINIGEYPLFVLPNPERIGIWLNQKKDEGKYFAEAVTAREKIENLVTTNAIKASLYALGATAPEYRTVIKSFKNTVDLPFEVLTLFASNVFPNLLECRCHIVPLVSRMSIRLFYVFAQYDSENWDSKKLVGVTDWQSEEVLLKNRDALTEVVDKIKTAFREYIQSPIRSKFGAEFGA